MARRVRVVQIPVEIYERLKHLAPNVSPALLNYFYDDIREDPCIYTVRGEIVPDVHGYLYCTFHVANLLAEFELE